MIELKHIDNNIAVLSPYNTDFIKEAKKLNGKWNSSMKAWVFDALVESNVKELIKNIYKVDLDGNQKTVNIKITALDDIENYHKPVDFNGIPVCSATGRDSGARLLDNVMLLEGIINSGGSVKNWSTYALKGATFIVKNVYESSVKAYNGIEWKVEILEDNDKKEKLQQEKEKLLKRLAEIEEELKSL